MMDGKWEDGQEINLKKFDDYYGDKAKIDAIHFQVIKDVETAYKEFQAGNLDVCDVPVAQIDAAKKDRGESKDGYTMGDGERMLLGSEPSTYYLTCNTTAEPFNNADLRRGISLAINREAICKTIFKGTRTPADGIVPPGIAGYKEGAWEFCAYDVDKANEYLDKVAPAGANGDRGINVTLSYNQDGGHKEIMESIIGDLAKVGVTAVSDTPEWSALLEQYQNFNYQFGRLAGSPITRSWTTSCTRCSTPTPSVATTALVTTTPSSMPRSMRPVPRLTTTSASPRCRRLTLWSPLTARLSR